MWSRREEAVFTTVSGQVSFDSPIFYFQLREPKLLLPSLRLYKNVKKKNRLDDKKRFDVEIKPIK